MDLVMHAPGGVQAPTPGDTSFIAALKAQRPSPNTSGTGTNEKRQCFYCDGEGHIRDRCPTRLKDYLQQQTRMGNRRPLQALGKGATSAAAISGIWHQEGEVCRGLPTLYPSWPRAMGNDM